MHLSTHLNSKGLKSIKIHTKEQKEHKRIFRLTAHLPNRLQTTSMTINDETTKRK